MIDRNPDEFTGYFNIVSTNGLHRKEALKGQKLNGIYLVQYDFRGLNLEETVFNGANLSGCEFSGCNLKGAEFRGCDLTDAKFLGADLSNSDFTGADLSRAKLQGAVLYRTNFCDANLIKVNLDGANVENAYFRINDDVGDPEPHQKDFPWWFRFVIVPIVVALLAGGYVTLAPGNNPEPSQDKTSAAENPN